MKRLLLYFINFSIILSISLTGLYSTRLVQAQAPVAGFIAVPTSGPTPLTVQFTDESVGSTGWAWYFGDEPLSRNWDQVTSSAGWSARYAHSSVVLPDGRIVLMGGHDGSSNKNDVWRSTNAGETWTQVSQSGAWWSARSNHSSAVLSDGTILLMGGWDGHQFLNDVWSSNDGGTTWSQLPDPPWSARWTHESIVLPDDSILLIGGWDGNYKNDVWRLTKEGDTWIWTNMTLAAAWSGRYQHNTVVLPNGQILLLGGYDGNRRNDIWRSNDNGATWQPVTASERWSGRYGHSSVVLPNGHIILMGGYDGNNKNDVWRSTDGGTTWSQLPDAPWSVRWAHKSVVLPDGSIVVIGGGTPLVKDVWRLETADSYEQHPEHTYVDNGSYTVTLQVSSNSGISKITKHDYIIAEVTVIFHPNGGTGTMLPQSSDVPTSLRLNTFTQEGFAFIGWNTKSDGTGVSYADGALYNFDSSITLYAQWEELPSDQTFIFLPLILK